MNLVNMNLTVMMFRAIGNHPVTQSCACMFRVSAAILCGVEHECTELSERPGSVTGAADSPEPG